MIGPTELAELSAWCEAHGTRFISDEIYHGITYDVPGTCAWASGRNSIVVNSFSKYFSMTGWRIGWLLVPDDLVDAVDRLAGNFTICPPALSQLAAVAAFDAYDELDANGAFYVYADVSRWTSDALAWSARLLDETGVAVAPGLDFDPVDGGRFIRMCFAGDGAEIEHAVALLGDWLARQPLL
jgi:aspartate/methionine/tyrosine aminotransferase